MKVCGCNHCDNLFNFKSNKRFCSRKCKERDKRSRIDVKRPYRLFVGSKCENCSFVPIHICQLDVDHIDGNKHNNNLSNLQTLCANCHRLKTYINKDWVK
jgi:hypothetical protein